MEVDVITKFQQKEKNSFFSSNSNMSLLDFKDRSYLSFLFANSKMSSSGSTEREFGRKKMLHFTFS
jgi:hypothetical protein